MTDLRDLSTGVLEYDALPEFLKQAYSPREYLWLSDAEKARLLQVETEPEWTEP